MSLAHIKQQAAAIAEISDDYNESTGGGGGGRLLKEGPCLARLVSYVDLGKQPQEYQGKPKDPCNEFRLGFALYGPDYQNEDGSPYLLETYSIRDTRNSKAGAFLLFQAMNWQKQATSFPQLIGDLFIVDIVTHTPKAEGSKLRSVINLKTVRPPLDPVSGRPYEAPPCPDNYYFLFSWKMPTIEAWNGLYIDGVNDKGKSKNWIQETILGATDFAGSELEGLLMQNNIAYTIPAKAPAAPAAALPGAIPGAVPAAPLAQPQANPVPTPAPSAQVQPAPAISMPANPAAAPAGPISSQVTTSPSDLGNVQPAAVPVAASPAVHAVPPAPAVAVAPAVASPSEVPVSGLAGVTVALPPTVQ